MKLIDLSLPVSNDLPGVSVTPTKTKAVDGWNATTLELYSHAGTHVDAPIHFEAGEQTIDTMPLEAFHAHCWVISCQVEENALIQIDHLGAIATRVEPGDGLIFKTGWSSKLGTPSYRDSLPRISKELATWIVGKGVKLVGVEPPSVADVNNLSEVTLIHEILLGGSVTIVEGLTNLEALEESEKVHIMALPLRIVQGDGCPVRAVAIME